ncbi:hypothetical protein Btru_077978, partial [Bulinus truncatus]
ATCGVQSQPVEYSRNLWSTVATCGVQSQPVEYSRNLWSSVNCGVQSQPVEYSRNLWSSVATCNWGCSGGLMDNSFRYIIANKGIDTESSYPYKPEDRKCSFKKSTIGATEKSFKDIESGNEDDLSASRCHDRACQHSDGCFAHESFTQYAGGVYNEPDCSTTQLSHAMLVVGYGSLKGDDYWIVKNSFGESWGMSGYILMSRNKTTNVV